MGKRIVNAYKSLDKNQAYSLKDAVKIVKENAKAKFDETIDIAINLGVDPKYADQMVRGLACAGFAGNGREPFAERDFCLGNQGKIVYRKSL